MGPRKTAIIVCDMWDLHHCLNAVLRGEELAPRMNQVLEKARRQGVLIIHAPSSCMDAYKDHPARKRAKDAPKAANLPKDIGDWCYKIPTEEKGKYPIDQTDGGEDDDPTSTPNGPAKLAKMGRNPALPGRRRSTCSRSTTRTPSAIPATRSGTSSNSAASTTSSCWASTRTCASWAGRSACGRWPRTARTSC